MLNISGLRSSPVLTALTGLVLIVFGVAGGWPLLVIVGVLLLVLAALGFLTKSRPDKDEPPAGGAGGSGPREEAERRNGQDHGPDH